MDGMTIWYYSHHPQLDYRCEHRSIMNKRDDQQIQTYKEFSLKCIKIEMYKRRKTGNVWFSLLPELEILNKNESYYLQTIEKSFRTIKLELLKCSRTRVLQVSTIQMLLHQCRCIWPPNMLPLT